MVVARQELPELGEHGGTAAQLAGPGRHGVRDCRTEDLITDHSEGRVVLLVIAVAQDKQTIAGDATLGAVRSGHTE